MTRSRSPLGANQECNEEVWQRRSAHRAAGVAAVKRSADYISATAAMVPRPQTPDPGDRKLSKRAWERGVQQWRMDLKGVVANLDIDDIDVIDDIDDSGASGAVTSTPTGFGVWQ